MIRAINIIGVIALVLLGVALCSRAQAETIEQVIARVAAITGLPVATPPKGGFRVLPLEAIPARYHYALCYYVPRLERITCREGYAYLRPHEVAHHLQKRAGWDFSNPDVKAVAQAQAQWAQKIYTRRWRGWPEARTP